MFAISFIGGVTIISKGGGKEMVKTLIEDVKSRYGDQLLSKEGVVGIGIGETATKEPCIKVYVKERSPKVEEVIPKELEGYPVEIEEIGEVKAL